MSRSEFRWNKKRKHYAYLFKDLGDKCLNIVLTTKPTRVVKGKEKRNIKLFRHPNPNSIKNAYINPFIYVDSMSSFYDIIYKWHFDKNDKRTIKRMKAKWRKYKKSQH